MKPTHRNRSIFRLTALLLALALLGGCGAPAADPAPAPTEAPAPAAADPAPVSPTEAPVPPLQAHTAFLFPDADGFLRPDEPIAADELRLALDALQPSGAAAELNAVEAGSISRRDFARRAAALGGWTAQERVLPAEGAAAPVDLDPGDPDFALLLEASVPHSADEQGALWTEAALAPLRESGPFLRGSELYCCGEDGFLLRGEAFGPLTFGEDGRFSSGDEELDGYVTEVIAALQAQYPDDAADRFAMLRHCYDYVRDTFSYLGRRHIVEDGKDFRNEDAKIIFSTGKGNCYNYAAAFRALARRLGYPAYLILRSLDDPENIHAWTDIVFDGEPYVFDPQLEHVYANSRFMLTYPEAQKFGRYTRPDQASLEADG